MTRIVLPARSGGWFGGLPLLNLFLIPFVFGLVAPARVRADGMFVVPKFVWDKHKDINEPTQKAILVYDAGREDLILQVKYEGPVGEFGWLIPVPNLPTVEKGSMKCFYELSKYTQEHFEPRWRSGRTRGDTLGMKGGGEPEPVKVIEVKTVGAYQIAVLSTKDAGALEKWLEANHFYFPTNKTDVLDAYVKQQWYFVAVKINLGKSFLGLFATSKELASGELHPLQISFASDRCVYPLKISSVNGQPSEVQVYVLSPEPLLEKAMLEKKLPLISSNDLSRAETAAQQFERMQLMQRNLQRRFMGGTALLPYAKVTKVDLPDSSQWIPRLADKSWWLTKQTWTFKPEEMRDLEFEPAITVFTDELGTKFGYYAANQLARFGADAVPAFIAAFQNTNPIVRINAAFVFNRHYGSIRDPRLTEAAVASLKDSEPEVRMAGINVMADYGRWNPKFAEPLVAMLRDKDAGVRRAAISGLLQSCDDLGKYVPVFMQMLKDKNPGVQLSGLEMLQHLQVKVPREDLLPFFKSADPEVVSWAFTQMQWQEEKISDNDAIALLQNSAPIARMLGLRVLDQNPDKQSVELALPLLRDPDELVRVKAAQTLRALTGQHFTEDQADEWGKWWRKNKTNFVVQLHPEELPPQFFGSPAGGSSDRPPPGPRP